MLTVLVCVPNNPTAPAREKRMHLAIDHGARVVTTFDLLVTHIVVDKTLTEGDIRKELKLIELPVSRA